MCAFIAYFVAVQINGFIGISALDKELPRVPSSKQLLESDQTTIADVPPTLSLRIADFGSVGVIPDAHQWGQDYSHNLRHFEKAILPDPPYIDEAEFTQAAEQFKQYVDLIASYGLNAITIPFLLEFMNFDLVEDGFAVYPRDDLFRQRHNALRVRFKELFAYANSKGVDILLYSDMVILTPPLKSYLQQKLGSLDPTKSVFWDVYKSGLQEIFKEFPEIKGIYIRIGEAGTIYNTEGWDYASELLVKTKEAVQTMLEAFLEVAEQFNKLVIFRTWSVGVGKIGDMHTNPDTYKMILENIDSNHLVVSTKYCNGDFYSYTPLNQTLYSGRHRRVIEFQARREFEGFNAFPLYMAPLHRLALETFMKENKHIVGVWLWTQYGGPLRAGPLSLYPFHGFNLITDLNVYATAQLAKDPSADINALTEAWIVANFGSHPQVVTELKEIFFASFETMKKGLYVSEFASKEVKALGLLPPPMLWIFEWDIVSAGNSVLSNLYYISKEKIDQMIAEGREAIREAKNMKRRLTAIQADITHNHQHFAVLMDSVDYQIDLFEVLASYRAFILNYYRWIDTGDKVSAKSWRQNLQEFKTRGTRHIETYGRNLDFPAYNFGEALAGVRLAQNTGLARNISAILAVVIFLLIAASIIYPGNRLAAGLRLIFTALGSPFRSSASFDSGRPSAIMLIILILLTIGAGLLCITGFAAPVTCIAVYAFTLTYIAMLFLLLGKDNPAAVLSILSPAILLWLVYLVISGVRGPALLWYHFWTSESFCQILVGITAFLLCWSYVVFYAVIRKSFKFTRAAALSIILLIQGIQFILLGAVSHLATLEKSLTVINDELLVLPGGLSRIMGITTHLDIPTEIPIYLLYLGIVLTALGVILRILAARLKFRNTSPV